MIESGQAKNENNLARKIGISRIRVCQYVRLLSLDDLIVNALEQLGAPLTEWVITKHCLRPYLRKTPKKTKKNI
jgi:predicted RecB family endonuclease